MAYLLLYLAEDGPAGDRAVRLSHTTIAHLLGARRQSVTRVVGSTSDVASLESRYGHTVIRDPRGLPDVMGSEPLP